MTLDSLPPDDRIVDISFFSRFDINKWTTIFLELPLLPVELAFPGDYRSREQIIDCYNRNLKYENQHNGIFR